MTTLRFLIPVLLACSFLSCSTKLQEEPVRVIKGKVIAIKDGDTIEIFYEGKALTVRLAHIDCPEIKKGQPSGKAAKQKASDLCFGEEVQVLDEGKFDRYGRLIAEIINADNQNVNKEMVRAGLAWHYIKYSSDSSYASLEIEARINKLGLWEQENPTPPWMCRKGDKTKRKSKPESEWVN